MKFKHVVGERVLCFEPDETKARVLYNAKIMDADIVKDLKGKKFVEYKIHFQGWNHAWDRWAEESFVLKDNEQNRKLQSKLARKAIRKLKLQKGKRRHHLPGVASKLDDEAKKGTDSSSDESFDSDFTNSTKGRVSESEEEEPANKRSRTHSVASASDKLRPSNDFPMEEDSSSSKDENHLRKILCLDIPLSLQRRLEEDNIIITRRNMLVQLPIQPNVVQILENYAKRFSIQSITSSDKSRLTAMTATGQTVGFDAVSPDKRLSLCQEVCCDLKLLFDYVLPLSLLYKPERKQFKDLIMNARIEGDDRQNAEKERSPKDKDLRLSSTSKRLNFDDISINAMEEEVPLDITSERSLTESIVDVKKQTKNSRMTSLSESSESPVPPQMKRRTVSESTSSTVERIEPQRGHHKKKTAEEQLIEETHKYLIPNQPNLDQTGLSKDAQGRRRSSRLTHYDPQSMKSSAHQEDIAGCSRDVILSQGDRKHFNDRECYQSSRANKFLISLDPYIFLRRSSKFKHLVTNAGGDGNPSSSRHPSTSARPPLFNSTPYLDKDEFVAYAGSDIKKIVEMAKAWNWFILPRNYKPEDGANVPPSLIYGIHHLLRMFVKLPDILIRMEIPEFKVKILVKHLNMLLKFLAEYERELFEVDSYVSTPSG